MVAGCVAPVGTAAALIAGASTVRVHDAIEPAGDTVDVVASVALDGAEGVAVAAGDGMLASGCDAVALDDVPIEADGAGERVTEPNTGLAAAPIVDDAGGAMADAADDTRLPEPSTGLVTPVSADGATDATADAGAAGCDDESDAA